MSSKLDPNRSYYFNTGVEGVVEIVAYFGSMLTSLHIGRMVVIRRMVVGAGVVHLLYFLGPALGEGSVVRLGMDVLVRGVVAFGNTFLAIYTL